jgi:hypothetical protein
MPPGVIWGEVIEYEIPEVEATEIEELDRDEFEHSDKTVDITDDGCHVGSERLNGAKRKERLVDEDDVIGIAAIVSAGVVTAQATAVTTGGSAATGTATTVAATGAGGLATGNTFASALGVGSSTAQ